MNICKTTGKEIARLAAILREEGWEVSSITIEPPTRTDILPGGSILKLKASPVDTAFLQQQQASRESCPENPD
jgi:hypothetical protein